MDLLGALGAAPARTSAKDADAPETKVAGDREQTREGFDEAMESAAVKPSEHPNEPDAASPKRGLAAPKIAFLLDAEEAEDVKDATDAAREVALSAETPLAAAQIDLKRDTEVYAEREGADIDLARPAASHTSPAAAPIARANAEIFASPGAAFPTLPDNLSKAVSFSSPTPFDAAVPDVEGPLPTERVKAAAAEEDKALRPEAGRTVTLGIDIPALPRIGAAPVTQPDVKDAVLAALQDLRPTNPHVEVLTNDPSDAQGKLNVALPAPAFTQLKEKLDSTLAPTPLPAVAGERAINAPDLSAQAPTAPKPEAHHHLAQAGPMDAARQVIAAIRTAAGGDGIEVRLDPPDLGRVRIHFTMERADSVVAVVSTDRSDTLDTMRRHAGDLVKELSRAGFAHVQLEFKSGGNRSHPEAAPKARISGVTMDDAPTEKATLVYARARLDGRLDRLV